MGHFSTFSEDNTKKYADQLRQRFFEKYALDFLATLATALDHYPVIGYYHSVIEVKNDKNNPCGEWAKFKPALNYAFATEVERAAEAYKDRRARRMQQARKRQPGFNAPPLGDERTKLFYFASTTSFNQQVAGRTQPMTRYELCLFFQGNTFVDSFEDPAMIGVDGQWHWDRIINRTFGHGEKNVKHFDYIRMDLHHPRVWETLKYILSTVRPMLMSPDSQNAKITKSKHTATFTEAMLEKCVEAINYYVEIVVALKSKQVGPEILRIRTTDHCPEATRFGPLSDYWKTCSIEDRLKGVTPLRCFDIERAVSEYQRKPYLSSFNVG